MTSTVIAEVDRVIPWRVAADGLAPPLPFPLH